MYESRKTKICPFQNISLYILLVHVRAGSFCPKLVRLTNEYLIHRRNQRSQKKAKRGLLQGRSKVTVYKSSGDLLILVQCTHTDRNNLADLQK